MLNYKSLLSYLLVLAMSFAITACDDCEDECRVKQCEPGELVCSDDRAFVYRCDETGTSLCYSHSCQSATTDGVCGGGECLAVCQAEQKSYLGCEYYAVDLDNANVPCGRDELGRDHV